MYSGRRRDSRSRSPRRHDHSSQSTRRRSRSPRQKRTRFPGPYRQSNALPYDARPLTKRDFDAFKPLFALYLDVQKGKIIEELDDIEVRGRWKSFYGKWNRGELPEGWYDPSTFSKATAAAGSILQSGEAPNNVSRNESSSVLLEEAGSNSDSDDSFGPALPGDGGLRGRRAGPSIPRMEDLELKREMDVEDEFARRDDIRHSRKLDRKQQKEALEDLVPRAEAGTRERQLEKKKEVNEKMKSFREKSPGAVEIPDADLMGGGDGIDSYKKQKEALERKKNEREIRRDEILRARQAERDERMQEYRAKEEGTMAMLKALAKQNFG